MCLPYFQIVQSTIVSSTSADPEDDLLLPETVSQVTAAIDPVAPAMKAAEAVMNRTEKSGRPAISSRWKRMIFKLIKYPLLILIVNLLLVGYIKRSLSDAELELNFRPAVPPFH